jgi:hypothetical protein
MDYCLSNKLPKGERHLVISRNMSLYIFNNPERNKLKQRYVEAQEGSPFELDGWLRSIDAHQNEKYPFSCKQLIKYQEENNIPFQCSNCSLYKKQQDEAEPRGWACSISIVKMAEKHNLESCHICHSPFIFNDKLGWFKCSKCSDVKGGLKEFARLIGLIKSIGQQSQ